VTVNGTALPGSYLPVVSSGAIRANMSSATLSGLPSSGVLVAGESLTVAVSAHDAYGNAVSRSDASFAVAAAYRGSAAAPVRSSAVLTASGVYSTTIALRQSGHVSLLVTYQGSHVPAAISAFRVQVRVGMRPGSWSVRAGSEHRVVQAGAVDATSCIFTRPPAIWTAGAPVLLQLERRDALGNLVVRLEGDALLAGDSTPTRFFGSDGQSTWLDASVPVDLFTGVQQVRRASPCRGPRSVRGAAALSVRALHAPT